MRRLLALPVLSLVALVAACSDGESRPKAWGEPRLADDEACPQVIGRYVVDDTPVPWTLALRHVPLADSLREPESFAIADQTADSLLVTIRYRDGGGASHTLRRGTAYDGDFYCADGWVRLDGRGVSSRWDESILVNGKAPKRRWLRFAPARDGAIIARLDGVWFEGFQPYAPGSGDGIPLPWTWKRTHAWSRTEPYSAAALARQRRLRTPAEQGRREALARTTPDRVFLEHEALENPAPPPSQALARQRLRGMLTDGVQVVAVTPRDDGWQVSVTAPDTVAVARFVSRLVERSDVLEARHESLYRSVTPDGLWGTVVFVRLASPG
jgi:hypothetical protein